MENTTEGSYSTNNIRTSEETINEYVNETIEQLETIEYELRPLRKKKKQLILDLAYKLSEFGAIPYEYVADYLCRHQKKILDYVSEDYIRGILPSETKNKKQIKKQTTTQKMEIPQTENKKVLEVTNTGEQKPIEHKSEPDIFAHDTARPELEPDTAEENESITTTIITMEPNLVWTERIKGLMNRKSNVYLVVNDNRVIDVRDKP